ncbi:hypothetical protein E2562_019854 [Oryza meyeriana var. granulata]|uniref:Uncharacterized protein n=1 Tax=Oryza meyeriana var. granulata TaxID=110450 RepID=A0A6G1CRX5_9ORYZ|nr:hypothetical protein E2562_019854 [Oryza meyeriana var. granulata]
MNSPGKKSPGKKGTVRLISTQSPLKPLDLSWIPDGSKEVDNWGGNDEVEYVGLTDKRESYKDLVSDDEEGDPDYAPGSNEDDDDLAVDNKEGQKC